MEESLLLNVKPTSCLTVFLVTPNVSLSSQRQEWLCILWFLHCASFRILKVSHNFWGQFLGGTSRQQYTVSRKSLEEQKYSAQPKKIVAILWGIWYKAPIRFKLMRKRSPNGQIQSNLVTQSHGSWPKRIAGLPKRWDMHPGAWYITDTRSTLVFGRWECSFFYWMCR